MKILKIIIIYLLFNVSTSFSQQKKDIFLLIETGYQNLNNQAQIHFGVGFEYYLSKKSSLSLRVKYLHTGIEYLKVKSSAGFASFFNFTGKKFLYKGQIISIPFNYKFENHFFIKKMKYFFSIGPALNFTLKNQFLITENLTPNHNNNIYVNLNLGLGFMYKLNKRTDLLISGETSLFGGAKTHESIGFIFNSKLTPDASAINFGVRYRLKN
ncbi:hypothetical protein [uncultured Tenacibaculum sp.]|uniref:hypothetical protein n=1 Tax=uncultured Tenacibaculum sp. TaxID=174713 RepID=UPI00262CAE46|nr:hypothetical protein [uncultured Tenacibaculum sp.]